MCNNLEARSQSTTAASTAWERRRDRDEDEDRSQRSEDDDDQSRPSDDDDDADDLRSSEDRDSNREAAICRRLSEPRSRDDCWKALILSSEPDRLTDIHSWTEEIADPIIRGAVIETWIVENCNSISLEQGSSLCELLEGRGQSYCQRRLSSPHLCTSRSETEEHMRSIGYVQ